MSVLRPARPGGMREEPWISSMYLELRVQTLHYVSTLILVQWFSSGEEGLEEVDSGGYVAGGQDDPGSLGKRLEALGLQAGSKVGLGGAKWSCFRFPQVYIGLAKRFFWVFP